MTLHFSVHLSFFAFDNEIFFPVAFPNWTVKEDLRSRTPKKLKEKEKEKEKEKGKFTHIKEDVKKRKKYGLSLLIQDKPHDPPPPAAAAAPLSPPPSPFSTSLFEDKANLIRKIPFHRLTPQIGGSLPDRAGFVGVTFCGPADLESGWKDVVKGYACGRSVSTYPLLQKRSKRVRDFSFSLSPSLPPSFSFSFCVIP